jgi:uncharacterized protein with HEPN domain
LCWWNRNCRLRYAFIGEAAHFIISETKSKFPDVEWDKIAGIRHILVHEYFGIDEQIVWQIIIADIPVLKQQIKNILTVFD